MTDDDLDACVRGLRKEMIDFTTELIAIASENPPGTAYPECVRAIESRLHALDLPCEVIAYRPGRGLRDESGAGVVLSHVGTGKRVLYFSGHYDVVPMTTPGQCTPALRGRTLFGRGSADMKGGLAGMVYAAVALKRLRVPLDGRVVLVFVPDEETGGQRGSGFLAATKRLGTNGIGMLTPEPTSGVVWNANRGALSMRVTVHGREAHVGLLHQGRNAFEDAIRVVAGLQRLAKRIGRRRTRFRVTPDAARRSLMLIGGRVEAGSNFNVVPGRCVFTVNRRMNPEEDYEQERQALFEVLDEAREHRSEAGRRGVPGRTPFRNVRGDNARPGAQPSCPSGYRQDTQVRDVSWAPRGQVLCRAWHARLRVQDQACCRFRTGRRSS